MKNYLKITFALVIIIILALLTYTFSVVFKARWETPGIISQALLKENILMKTTDLSRWQLHALLAVEDPNFYHHHGVDLKTPGAGITTISQALVKIYYFKHFTPGLAKFKQTLIARYAFNPLVPKNDQLTLFINNAYLGEAHGKSVIGFAQAAQVYYGKTFAKLTKEEYLSIIAMLIAPNTFNILSDPAANAERTRRIKSVVSGAYKPKHLMDIYYGKLDKTLQRRLPPASYIPSIYQ